ncbi:MAG: cation transporter [Lawsonibacter sp.]|jgi:copper chaperone CopZ
MKKSYSLINLDCANCAAKMENGIRKLDGVTGVTVSFLTQKLTLEAPEEQFQEILEQAVKVCKKVEPDCKVVIR